MIYLDTSVLVKLYAPEPDSRTVAASVREDPQIVVSDLTRLEFASAVARLTREGLLPGARGRTLIQRLEKDWSAFTRVRVSDEVLVAAQALLWRHPLRTLDALQLGTALIVTRSAPTALRFGTADRRLAEAAEAEGLAPLQPR